jgi:hypothetical protein
MDSSEGRYGWATDDPRWTDAHVGGRGRLDPPPPPTPSFADADTIIGAIPPLHYGAPAHEAQTETLPAWPDAAAPPAPFTLHTQYPTAGVRPGYGMTTGPSGPTPRHGSAGGAVVRRANGTPPASLTRRLSALARRRGDDEFRRAGRAELFSDDARYSVLFALTATWYSPVAAIFLLWVLVLGGGDEPTGPRLLSGLVWLSAAAALSLGVVGLLRWARIGWRALTLSIAAALIGGGVATIAHTLSG